MKNKCNWVSVEEKLPPLGVKVLLATESDIYTGGLNSAGTFNVLSDAHGWISSYKITHWAQMPPHPIRQKCVWMDTEEGTQRYTGPKMPLSELGKVQSRQIVGYDETTKTATISTERES